MSVCGGEASAKLDQEEAVCFQLILVTLLECGGHCISEFFCLNPPEVVKGLACDILQGCPAGEPLALGLLPSHLSALNSVPPKAIHRSPSAQRWCVKEGFEETREVQ